MNTKILVGICICGLACSAAFAHSLRVPFFRDNGGLLVNGTPPSGAAAFIGLQNTTATDITVTMVYTQLVNGLPVQQPGANFVVPANATVSWRPIADDPLVGDSPIVPNAPIENGPTGSIDVFWAGGAKGPFSLAGRYVEITQSGPFSYLLPASG